MKSTKSKTIAVQRKLGMINYVSELISNLTVYATNLRALLCRVTVWHWTVEHVKKLNYIKNTQ